MIPRIIHQVWHQFREPGTVPLEIAGLPQSWKRHHPTWDYRLWTDDDSRELIANYYPELLSGYNSYDYPIQRVDAVRYCLLHRFGGVYVDMDIECLRSVEPLLGSHHMVLTLEPPIHARYKGLRTMISNAFMAARPGHPLLAEVLEDLAMRPIPAVLPQDVFVSTGPMMLSKVHARRRRLDVHVEEHRVVSPYAASAPELLSIRSGGKDVLGFKLACIAEGAYAVHYWSNTWSPSLGTIVNPTPHDVAGFLFFQGCDSPGFDVRQEERDVESLARTCARWDATVAFNTDGFIKSRVRPKWRWRRSGGWQANEGLYVKVAATASPLWPILGCGRKSKPRGRKPGDS